MIKIVIKITTISNTIIPKKMTSRTYMYTSHMGSIRDHTLEIDQWECSKTGTNIRVPTQSNQLIRGHTCFNTSTSSGLTKLDS